MPKDSESSYNANTIPNTYNLKTQMMKETQKTGPQAKETKTPQQNNQNNMDRENRNTSEDLKKKSSKTPDTDHKSFDKNKKK